MFGHVVGFVVAMAMNGILAGVLSFVICFLAAVVLPIAAIPVEVIFGKDVSQGILSCILNSWLFRVVYAIVFINLMLDTYNIRNLRRFFWKRKLVTLTTDTQD
ncbi:MAG: hypothetical protein PHS73_03055 [Candidatus Peribacteraceae bacterium]|nr:hypothetical protein [Candidatus Peribacteraceae bacterium]